MEQFENHISFFKMVPEIVVVINMRVSPLPHICHSLLFLLYFLPPLPQSFIFPEFNILSFSLDTLYFRAGLRVLALYYKVKPLLRIPETSQTQSCMSKIGQILLCDCQPPSMYF